MRLEMNGLDSAMAGMESRRSITWRVESAADKAIVQCIIPGTGAEVRID